MLKKDARLIVKKQYSILNTNGKDNHDWAKGITVKVQGLLDGTGPLNMTFTDGPSNHNFSKEDF